MSTCPPETELLRFARGDVSDQAWQQIAIHLETCSHCLERLESIDTRAVLAVAAQDRPATGARAPLEYVGGEQEFQQLAQKVLPWAWTAQALAQASQDQVRRDEADLGEHQGSATSAPEDRSKQLPTNGLLASAPSPVSVGRRLGHYRLLEEIGRGAMGVVYRAEHIALRRQVAIKCLHPRRTSGPDVMLRFRREMAAVGRIDHPNLVRATDAGEIDGHPFIAMDFVAGIDLERLGQALGPLPIGVACELVAQAAAGLEHAHRCGLIHRDVKPSNLLLGRDAVVRVLDLGLALEQPYGQAQAQDERANEHDFEQTIAGSILGTRAYMAPEQRVSSRQVDPRADVYGLAATLIRLLWGFPPSALASDSERVQARMPQRNLRSDLPESLYQTLCEMVALDPNQRPASMQQVLVQLAPYRDGVGLLTAVEQCCRKGLIQGGAESAVLVAPRAVPPTIEALVSNAELPKAQPWLWIGVACCIVGMLAAAVALGIQLGRSQSDVARLQTRESVAGAVAQADHRGEVIEREASSLADQQPGEQEQSGVPGAFGSPIESPENGSSETATRRDIPRPIRGDRIVVLHSGSLVISDSAALFDPEASTTVEVWLRHESDTVSVGQGVQLMGATSGRTLGNPFSNRWSLGIETFGLGPRWALSVDGRDISRIGGMSDTRFRSDHWHHLALQRRGISWSLWLDGRMELSASETPIGLQSGDSGDLTIGAMSLASPLSSFRGAIAGIRISEGIRFTEAFEPTFPLELDDSTLCLIDGNSPLIDSQWLRDHSPHARDARLLGGELSEIR